MSLKVRVRALSHRVTWLLGTRWADTFPFVFVLGYPKSGTTWVCQLLAECLDVPFPRHSLLPVGCPAVVHGHRIMTKRYRKAVYVMRDGRDVMISLYFDLCRQIPEGDHPRMSSRLRKELPGLVNKENVAENLPRFIEQQVKRSAASPANWSDHLGSYYAGEGERAPSIRYEDLLSNGTETLSRVLTQLTGAAPRAEIVRFALERYSFSRQSGRRPGTEDRSKFLRRGKAGDWTRYFGRDSAEVFDRHFGAMLVQAGYETDRSWVDRCE